MTAIGHTPVTRSSPAAGSQHGNSLTFIGPAPRITPIPCTVHNRSKLSAGWGNRQSPGRGKMSRGRGATALSLRGALRRHLPSSLGRSFLSPVRRRAPSARDPRARRCGGGSAGQGAALWSPARPGDQAQPGPRYSCVVGPGARRPGPGRSAAVVRRPRRGAVLGVELLEGLRLLGHGRLARGARVAEAGPGAGQDAVHPGRGRGRVVPRLAPGHALLERGRRTATGAGHRA